MSHLQQLGEGDISKVSFVENLLFQGRVNSRKESDANKHSWQSSEQSVQGTLSDRPDHGPGTVAEDAEPYTENEAADEGGSEGTGLRVELSDSHSLQPMNADLSNDDGREHDLDHGEIRQKQLPDDHIVSGHPALLEQKSKEDPDAQPNGQL